MKKKQFRNRLRLLIVLTMLLIALTTFAVGKYIKTIEMDSTITFTSKLADDVIIQEHKAVRQPDGSYVLDKSVDPVGSNTYKLIPGLDVPKDPHIIIEGKTPVQAYLYLEVVDSTENEALSYSLENFWKESDGFSPKHEGKVYIYAKDTTPVIITTDPGEISVLQEETFYVGQELLSGETTNGLVFYAYLVETTKKN